MTYVLPAVQVFQDFTPSPAAQANPLRAHITGPHAQLIRYAQDAERELGFLGYYDAIESTPYLWPEREPGGVIDQPYVKLFIKDALLQYFTDNTTCTKGGRSQITSSAINFVTNGNFARDTSLGDRDVTIGDVVKAVFSTSGSPVVLWSYVNGTVASLVASSILAASSDGNNGVTATASASVDQSHGPFNAVNADVSTASDYNTYNPYPTGRVTEQYTIIVIQDSVNGDYTTARFRVISASGLDDQASITPLAEGSHTPIGTHGLKVRFRASGSDASASAEAAEISPNDLLAGQRWIATVRAAYTATTSTSNSGTHSGVYSGISDTIYIVEVLTGGKFVNSVPTIMVTTDNGYDISGPTPVHAAAAFVSIGTKGAQIKFTGAGLLKGDRFYVSANAAADGDIQTLTLGHSIPTTVANGTPCTLTLFIRKPVLQIPMDRLHAAPLTNFDMVATQITVNSGISSTDPTWTVDGSPVALPVFSESSQNYGRLYVEYRAWLPDLAGSVGGITDVANIDEQISGALDPDNPIKWAVYKTLANANGTEVKYTSVADPSQTTQWADVLSLLFGRDDVYGLVPLTQDVALQQLWAAHINDSSTPASGLWRSGWFSLSGVPSIPLVSAGSTVPHHTSATTGDGEVALGTILDDSDTSGTQYTIVTVPAGNAKFITNGVRAGDVVRALYTGDGFGNSTYQEFVIDAVITEDEVRLVSGPASPVNLASKLEVWRNLNADDESAEIAIAAGNWANRRIRAVWPDEISTAGTAQAGYHVCAALAGLASGVLPQQPLTRVALTGFDDVSRTTTKFNSTQLDRMAASGTWIVTQAHDTGEVYTRHAVTTGSYDDLNQREEMVTRNLDSISFRFKDELSPFIGISNITPATLESMRLECNSLITVLKTESAPPTLGGQLIDGTITDLRQHLTLKDHIVIGITVTLPYPFNNADVHLLV